MNELQELIDKLQENGFRERGASYDFDHTYTGPKKRGTETGIVIHLPGLNVSVAHVITARAEWYKVEARERLSPNRMWGAEGATWSEALANTCDFEQIEGIEDLLY